MRRVPVTAFGRTALLLVVVLLLSQMALMLLLRVLIVRPATEQMASLLADQVSLVERLLPSGDPAQVARALQRLADGQELRVFTEAGAPPGGPPLMYYQEAFARLLRERLGQRIGFLVQRRGETVLWVRVPADAPYWIGMSARRLEGGVPGAVLAWVLALGVSSVLAAALLARYLTTHLTRLARLAARLGRGELPPRFDQGGPAEIRALAGTLDRMARDLRQAAEDRALLLAGISHDLRTPLARMRLAVEMLGETDGEIRTGMVEDLEEMDAIVGQFIGYVRDGHDEAPQTLDLNELIHQICGRFGRLGVVPQVEQVPLPPLSLRPMAMARLLSNLLENARRHAAEPIGVHSRLLDGRLRVSVLDRGPGIAPGDLERVFLPFARGEGGRVTRGSGLGLMIGRRIARLHGGELTLHNRPGGGTEARLELPL